MKAFLRLRMLCLLAFQAWTQGYPVKTACTLVNILVSVKRNMFNDGIWVNSDDLVLGNGCPVNNVIPLEFEFRYSVRECGINTKVYATKLIFKTVVHYNPQFRGIEYFHSKTEYYVSCSVDRIVLPQYYLTSPKEDPQSSKTGSLTSMKGPMFSAPQFNFFSSK